MGLPKLMARLGRLLERYGPDGVVVMSAAEFEQAQLAAYASGWQDAAEEYGPRIAAARWDGWLGRWRPLRVMEGPAEVIDFAAHRPQERDTAEPDGPDGPDREARGGGADGGQGGADPERRARVGADTPVPRPFLSPKNRRSKSPTIPRLSARERRRPRTASDDDTPN
jgi:hypothetical protein